MGSSVTANRSAALSKRTLFANSLTPTPVSRLKRRAAFSHESKRAVVASKRVMYVIAQMYKLIRKDDNIALFKTVGVAKAWLGLSTNS
jgi:hypothetical protein